MPRYSFPRLTARYSSRLASLQIPSLPSTSKRLHPPPPATSTSHARSKQPSSTVSVSVSILIQHSTRTSTKQRSKGVHTPVCPLPGHPSVDHLGVRRPGSTFSDSSFSHLLACDRSRIRKKSVAAGRTAAMYSRFRRDMYGWMNRWTNG